MLKVVFDTNVFISAFISPGSKAEEAYLLAIKGKVELYTSLAILAETAGKLKDKFRWDNEKIEAAVKHISKCATVVKPKVKVQMLADTPDNRILECAKEAGAHLIVTGDKHLLGLKEFEGIGITRIAGFLHSIPSDKGN
ncbi:MAG TPA: putative toxin-antitoxin system toxin component, PIN family [Dissulfurispiraceae bacterium]|nr:putative toxin-antitoxin system toxin component, PIN family [Dissulfurispiraceae bacterium]